MAIEEIWGIDVPLIASMSSLGLRSRLDSENAFTYQIRWVNTRSLAEEYRSHRCVPYIRWVIICYFTASVESSQHSGESTNKYHSRQICCFSSKQTHFRFITPDIEELWNSFEPGVMARGSGVVSVICSEPIIDFYYHLLLTQLFDFSDRNNGLRFSRLSVIITDYLWLRSSYD